MRKVTIPLALIGVAGFLASPASADFTTVANAGGGELHLWQALNNVAPIVGGWDAGASNMNFINNGAGGLRVLDRADNPGDVYDQIWRDGVITCTATALFWGGGANPIDVNGQNMVYDNQLDGSTMPRMEPSPVVNYANAGTQSTFTLAQHEKFIIGDDANSGLAWSREALNSGMLTDRMITFNVSGLAIFAWDGSSSYIPIFGASGNYIAPAGSYILAFDPGNDSDYQDMLIYMEGAHPIPAPGAVLLGLIGLGLVGRINRRLPA